MSYLSLKKLAKKYDIHPDTIKRKNLIEGVHFIRVGKLYRYHIENIDKLFTCKKTNETDLFIDQFRI
jgi:hypothetical protein